MNVINFNPHSDDQDSGFSTSTSNPINNNSNLISPWHHLDSMIILNAVAVVDKFFRTHASCLVGVTQRVSSVV